MTQVEQKLLQVVAKFEDLLSQRVQQAEAAVRKSTKGMRTEFTGLRGVVGEVRTVLTGLRATAAGLGLYLAGRWITETARGVDQLRVLADAVGSTVTEIDALKLVMGQTGIEAQKLEPFIGALARAQNQALRGAQEQVQAFRSLGISIEDLRKSGAVELLQKIGDASGRLDSRGALQSIFGDQARTGFALLQGGNLRGRIGGQLTTALSTGDAARVQEFERTLNQVSAEFERAKRDALLPLLPVLDAVAKGFRNVIATGSLLQSPQTPPGLQQQFQNQAAAQRPLLEAVFGGKYPAGSKPGEIIPPKTAGAGSLLNQLQQSLGTLTPEQLRASQQAQEQFDELQRKRLQGSERAEAEARAQRDKTIQHFRELREKEVIDEQTFAKARLSAEILYNGEVQKLEKETFDRNQELLDDARARLLEGKDRELAEIERNFRQQVRALERAHADQLISEEAFQQQMAALRKEASDELLAANGGFFANFFAETKRGVEAWADFSAAGRDASRTIVIGGLNGVNSALADTILNAGRGGEAWKNLGKTILRALAELIPKLVITKLLMDAIFGPRANVNANTPEANGFQAAANGAVWAGGFRAVKAFAAGSPRVDRPTLGVIGEGRMPEAVIPLPDGRSVPVSMSGRGGGNTYHFTIQSIDTQSGAEFIGRHMPMILAGTENEMAISPPYRASIRRAAR